jgi:hypothetical protein
MSYFYSNLAKEDAKNKKKKIYIYITKKKESEKCYNAFKKAQKRQKTQF